MITKLKRTLCTVFLNKDQSKKKIFKLSQSNLFITSFMELVNKSQNPKNGISKEEGQHNKQVTT